MFRVTVMMFRDIVESVMLLKDDDCNTMGHNEMSPCQFSLLPTDPMLSAAPVPSAPCILSLYWWLHAHWDKKGLWSQQQH